MSTCSRNYNWNVVAWELDKIGINIEDDVLTRIKAAQQTPIDKLFSRIERYLTIIAGKEFLKLENVEAEDLQEELDDDFLAHQATQSNVSIVMSDLVSLRQNSGDLGGLSRQNTGGD